MKRLEGLEAGKKLKNVRIKFEDSESSDEEIQPKGTSKNSFLNRMNNAPPYNTGMNNHLRHMPP